MKTELTYDQQENMIARALGIATNLMEDKSKITNYQQALEKALVKSLVKNITYKQELRRLNESVKYINSLVAERDSLQDEINVLVEILDRDEEPADTDPAPAPTPIPVQFPSAHPDIDAAYHEWDMRTRFPELQTRK